MHVAYRGACKEFGSLLCHAMSRDPAERIREDSWNSLSKWMPLQTKQPEVLKL